MHVAIYSIHHLHNYFLLCSSVSNEKRAFIEKKDKQG